MPQFMFTHLCECQHAQATVWIRVEGGVPSVPSECANRSVPTKRDDAKRKTSSYA